MQIQTNLLLLARFFYVYATKPSSDVEWKWENVIVSDW